MAPKHGRALWCRCAEVEDRVTTGPAEGHDSDGDECIVNDAA
jgi:hypothetical protein